MLKIRGKITRKSYHAVVACFTIILAVTINNIYFLRTPRNRPMQQRYM